LAALGPVLLAAGRFAPALAPATAALGRFGDGFRSPTVAASSFSGAMGTLGGTVSKAVGGLGRAFSGLFGILRANPFVAIIGAVAAVGVAIGTFLTQTETGRALLQRFFDAVKPIGDVLLELAGTVGDAVG